MNDAGTDSVPLVTAASYIEQTFGKAGFLAQGKADYEPRPGQIAFARAVDHAIATGGTICRGDHVASP